MQITCQAMASTWLQICRGGGENFQDHLETTVQGVTHGPISFFRQDKGVRGGAA